MNGRPWHRDSRFWMLAPYVIILSAILTYHLEEPTLWVGPVSFIMAGGAAQTTVRHHHDGKNGHYDHDDEEEDLP